MFFWLINLQYGTIIDNERRSGACGKEKVMRQIKWGVLGTAYIFERDTARGMSLAENCELTAIAGRSMEKAERFKEKY